MSFKGDYHFSVNHLKLPVELKVKGFDDRLNILREIKENVYCFSLVSFLFKVAP